MLIRHLTSARRSAPVWLFAFACATALLAPLALLRSAAPPAPVAHTWTPDEQALIADLTIRCTADATAPECHALMLPPNGPQAAVGLYWFLDGDPTVLGMAAPIYQLLIRTDVSELYYKSGAANTAWTLIGGGGGGGGTVTSITCGAGLSCSPNPITTAGTVSLAPDGSATVITVWTGSNTIGQSSASDTGSNFFIGSGGFEVVENDGDTLIPELDLTGHVTAPALAANANNWNPTGTGNLNGISRIDEAPTVNVTITGLNIGNASQVVSIHNTSTAFTITMPNASSSSLASAQFTLPNAGDVQIPPGGAVALRASATASGWRVWSSALRTPR